MPPAKRKAEQVEEATAAPVRVTRAAAKRSAAASSEAERFGEETKVIKKVKAKAKKEKEAKVEAVSLQSPQGDSSQNLLDASNNTIVVEHCKQCTSFKKRAIMVKEELEKAGCGITVMLNPDKPRRGCFEIRQGDRRFISLLNMKRPFKPMKDLDMDKVISDIIDEISKTS